MEQEAENGERIAVKFTYVNSGRQAEFPVSKDAGFDDVVNRAYDELGEQRRPSDNLFRRDGAPLVDYIDKTLRDVADDINKVEVEIRGPSGGAALYFEER